MARQILPRFCAVGLLLILTGLQLSSLAFTAVTMDEPSHLVSGYAFLTRGDTRIKLNGPILPNALGAAPLLLQPDLKLVPADDPMWDTNDHNDISDLFVWSNTASPSRIIFLARFPFIAISWLLGAMIFRWARERNGARAASFALALYVFCPNILAHSRFVMTDFAPTAIACLALYAFDRSLRQPSNRKWLILAGIGLGLALASKFSLVMLVIALPVVMFFQHPGLPVLLRLRQLTRRLLPLLAIAAIVVWGVYEFQIGPVHPGGIPVPAPGFWREWESAQYYLNQPWPNYLFGQTSQTGWWYYFPIAFVLKTPLPVLILLVLTLARTIIKRTWRDDLIFLVPSLLIFFSLLFSTNNLGYRYLLPVLPLIFVYVSALWPRALSPSHLRSIPLSAGQGALVVLLVWQIVGTLRIYPYYLTYFNEIAGGPDRGRYILSDSNIDWGQDLIGLQRYVVQNQIDRIKLSYFGVAHPAAYGLQTTALLPVRTAMNDQGAWWLHTYYPHDPAPGQYAISVANLMGGIWIDPAEYAFFRDRKPDTTIGNSIYIYSIEPRGEAADLSLAGLQIDQIDPDTYPLFGTNDVRPRWFDATASLIAAPGEAWIAIADNQPVAPEIQPLFEGVDPVAHGKLTDENRSYALYHFDLAQRMMNAARQAEMRAGDIALPVQFGDSAELIGYRAKNTDQGLTLITYWRAGDTLVTPLQMFVHLLGPDGAIVAQTDRLDASPFGWRSGDLIAQVDHLAYPASAKDLQIAIGLYNSDSSARLPVTVNGRNLGDQLFLQQIGSQ